MPPWLDATIVDICRKFSCRVSMMIWNKECMWPETGLFGFGTNRRRMSRWFVFILIPGSSDVLKTLKWPIFWNSFDGPLKADLRTRTTHGHHYFGCTLTTHHANTVRDGPLMLFYKKNFRQFLTFYFFSTVRTQPHSNAMHFKKSCQKLISQEGSVGAKQIICDSDGPVTSTKLTVGIFLSSNSMGVIAI